MAYAKLTSNQPISAGLHRAYLRDRKQFVKPAYALPFNDEDYQQELEPQPQPQDYLASIKGAIYQAKDIVVNLWDRSAHW